MDPLSAGASVLAFVGILNSLRFIYDTLLAVQDGPENVRAVASQVEQLHSIVEQLQNQKSSDGLDLATEIHLEQDAAVIQQLAGKLSRLQIYPAEKRTGVMWKRVKAALDEKELNKASAVIENCVTILTMQLLVGQRDTMTRILSSLDDMRQPEFSMPQMQREEPSDTSPARPLHSDQPGGYADKAQVDEMLQILRQLQAKSSHSSGTGVQPTVEVVDENLEGDKGGANDIHDDLMETIDSLCLIIGDSERTIKSDQADDITNKLKKIVGYADITSQQQNGAALSNSLSTPVEVGSYALLIMACDRLQMYKFVVGQNRKRKQLEFDFGSLVLTTTKRRRKNQQSNVHPAGDSDDELDEFSATLSFLPSANVPHKRMLTISLQQIEYLDAVSLRIPRIHVNRIFPRDSLVFKLVLDGALDELRELLTQGEASIRDHDEDGRSLLNYSTRQPEVCKFLVCCGLDVDHIARSMFDSTLGPLLLSDLDEYDLESTVLHRVNEYRKILLEAGADPTVPWRPDGRDPEDEDIDNYSTCSMVFYRGKPSSVQVLIDHGDAFCNIRSRDAHGLTPLLQMLGGFDYGYVADVVSFLLRRGASVHDRDVFGRTCLHAALEGARGAYRLQEEFTCLTALINAGADVRATDNKGCSVSEIAYTTRSCVNLDVDEDDMYGGYLGDFWDAVLATCGYNPLDFRTDHPRMADFTTIYTPEHFRQLWEGREHLCPYWNEFELEPEDYGGIYGSEDEASNDGSGHAEFGAETTLPDSDATGQIYQPWLDTVTLAPIHSLYQNELFDAQQPPASPNIRDIFLDNPWKDTYAS
ncbi:ankyrin repeat protein [Seiridium cupressi]